MDQQSIRLSIVTVTYNAEKYLSHALESVLGQEYPNYEYIIVDGKSTDNTLGIINGYIPKFEGRLRYISEPDKGLYDAMNKGIQMATGDYIGIINADDAYRQGAFEAVASCAIAGNMPDVIYSDLERIDEDGKIWGTIIGDANLLKKGMLVNHPTCFVNKNTYRKFGLFDLKYRICADYDLMLRIYHGGGSFYKSNRVLSQYRTGGLSWDNYNSVLEKYKIQRNYYGLPHCLYIKARGFLRCKVKPIYKVFKWLKAQ